MPATSVWDAVDYVKCCKHDWTPEEEDLVLQLQRALGEPVGTRRNLSEPVGAGTLRGTGPCGEHV